MIDKFELLINGLILLVISCCVPTIRASRHVYQPACFVSYQPQLGFPTSITKNYLGTMESIIVAKAKAKASKVETSTDTSVSVLCPLCLSPLEAQEVVDTKLLPQNKYGDRIGYGRDAQNLNFDEIIRGDDPTMAFTYGEFPLSSFDSLVNLGLQYSFSDDDDHINDKNKHNNNNENSSFNLVDLGSGCGRLALYAALSRPSSWNIDGIEISEMLHNIGLEAMELGVKGGVYSILKESNQAQVNSSLTLHLGPADMFSNSVLPRADMIFAYSTTWSTSGFSEDLGAMVLEDEWNTLLGESCRNGCVAITTDRALDPKYGWKLVDRMEVENREVFGSIGYVHVLQKYEAD